MPPRDDEVQALVEQLSADLDRSVLVDDASLRLLAYSPTLGDDAAARDAATHELASGDVLVAGATVGVLALRRTTESDAELGPAERARLGLALDQFRRTLPRRQALSTVQADHGVLIVALSE